MEYLTVESPEQEALKAEAQEPESGSEAKSRLLKDLKIPDDLNLVSQVLNISGAPDQKACDRRRQSPAVSGRPVADTCGLELSRLYPELKESVAQVLTRTNGTILFGTAFKFCDMDTDKKEECFFVSNSHVVGSSNLAGIANQDGKTVSFSKVLARDSFKDLVLIEVPEDDSRPSVSPGKSPLENDSVFTIGFPFGFPEPVLAAGKVSKADVGLQKEYPAGSGHIEIQDGLFASTVDALQGNSGGPEFNEKGELVGIKVIALEKGGSVNIKVEDLQDLLRRYREFKKAESE